MAIRPLKEVSRLPGFTPSLTIIGGGPVRLIDNSTIIAYDATAVLATQPLGLASDTTVQFAAGAGADGYQAGSGYDYPNYNRGGLVGVFCNGGVFELFDDGRGHPCDTSVTWLVNQSIFANNLGKLTNTSTTATATVAIGTVVAVTGSSTTVHVTAKMLI